MEPVGSELAGGRKELHWARGHPLPCLAALGRLGPASALQCAKKQYPLLPPGPTCMATQAPHLFSMASPPHGRQQQHTNASKNPRRRRCGGAMSRLRMEVSASRARLAGGEGTGVPVEALFWPWPAPGLVQLSDCPEAFFSNSTASPNQVEMRHWSAVTALGNAGLRYTHGLPRAMRMRAMRVFSPPTILTPYNSAVHCTRGLPDSCTGQSGVPDRVTKKTCAAQFRRTFRKTHTSAVQ